jgi:DNA-binding GntR family transcriptional regulator
METDKIFEILHKQITNLDLLPEKVLNLSDLAELFKVSRTPIKEALIYLQAEGLVIRHGSHFMVTPLSLDRIKEITEIRAVLEVQANIWAMNRATDVELEKIEELNNAILQLDKDASNRKIVELDRRFHDLMYQLTKNAQLAQILKKLLDHYSRFWLYFPCEMKPIPFFKETLKIIKAIKAKNEAELRMATIAHIRESLDEISNYMAIS